MRVQHIKISEWRHFQDVELHVPESAPVVCLVGGNGTGKTQILELIAAAAQQIGLSSGFASGRGNPFTESCDLEVRVSIAAGAVPTLDQDTGLPGHLAAIRPLWDRTLTITRKRSEEPYVEAGGVSDQAQSRALAQHLINLIRLSRLVHYLMLDADRAYPRIQVQSHEVGAAFETDWNSTLKEKSYLLTKSLYEEWFRYLLGTENRENNAHISSIRLARERGEAEPIFNDKMKGYGESIKKILPHLFFVGIDSQRRLINFDSTGTSLTFDQLSGGEREIAFLVGQIERFALRKGLLLVDEPELHLNYDLLRAWIGFLKGTVEEGQIWLASHSLEVVEVTGRDATFLLERDQATRKVVAGTPLASRPVVSTLSRAIGSPAFSIANLTFILVEGEEEIGERERFRLLAAAHRDVRFMEAGNCSEVIRRIDALTAIATASGEHLKIGGVLDRDWRGRADRTELEKKGLHVLAVHEVENFFLHPATVRHLIDSISGDAGGYEDILQAAADRRAGTWIFDAARTDKSFESFPPPHAKLRELVHQLTWADFQDIPARAQQIVDMDPELEPAQKDLLKRHVETHAKIYARVRAEDKLWKVCEGKEVFRSIVSSIGFIDAETAERAILGAWVQNESLVPAELIELRTYIESRRGL